MAKKPVLNKKDIKKQMGYQPRPVFEMCSNCDHIKSDMVPAQYNPRCILEKNIRCGLGGFPVKKQGTCDEHKFKKFNDE